MRLTLPLVVLAAAPACAAPSTIASVANEPGDALRLEPKSIAWSDLDASTFDLRWLLPESPSAGNPDMLARMRRLTTQDVAWRDASGEERTLRFGDLVLATRDLDDRARREWLDELSDRAPAFAGAWREEVDQLLRDAYLFSDDWKPGRDAEADGVLFGDPWKVHEDPRSTWTDRADPKVEQAAALFIADLHAIKQAESDYRLYPDNVGTEYEEIRPVVGSLVEGTDDDGRPFVAHRMYFRRDLPFPFGDYECDLHVLTRFNGRQELVTDIYSPTDDFYYLGGRDTFLPVETAEGEWVGYLNVRRFGFDLDGVPDGTSHRTEAMRGSLGNLRRNAERLFRESGGERRCEAGVMPQFEVLGEPQE